MTGKHIHQFYTHLPWTGEGQKVFQTVNHYHLQAAMSQRLMSKAEHSAKANIRDHEPDTIQKDVSISDRIF